MARLRRKRWILKWGGLGLSLVIVAAWVASRSQRRAEGIEPIYIVSEGRPLDEVTSVSVRISVYPDILESIGIKEDDIRGSVEARLNEEGLRIEPLDSSSCPEVYLGISVDTTKEELLSESTRPLKGYILFCIRFKGEKNDTQEWTKRCRFASRPRNLPGIVRDAMDRVLNTFANERKTGQERVGTKI